MGMTKTSNALRIARPTTGTDGKISALSLVKSMIASGIEVLPGSALLAMLTDTERTELGL